MVHFVIQFVGTVSLSLVHLGPRCTAARDRNSPYASESLPPQTPFHHRPQWVKVAAPPFQTPPTGEISLN